MRYVFVLLAVVFSACEAPSLADVVSSVECPPVSASQPLVTGDVLAGDLRGLAVDNGIIRIRYGAHAMDFRDEGPITENTGRHMDHVLAARHTDDLSVAAQGCLGACHNGTHWHDATYPWYGDTVTYSSALVDRDADRVRVLRADDDAIELSYEWDSIALNVAHPTGPASRDHNGAANYTSGGVLKYIPTLRKLWKTVRVEQCTPGYYFAVRSDPPLIWPDQGPRSIRAGYASARAAWACNGSAVAQHPSAGQHVSLGTTDCIGAVPDPRIGTHDGWPFVVVLRLATASAAQSLQYGPTQLGSPGVTTLAETFGPDGRPLPWQAFLGAVEYESPDLGLEPSPAAIELAQGIAHPSL